MKIKLVIILLFISVVQAAFAGPYADTLGRSLVDSTTPAEKRVLVRWMFASMSLHPELKDFVSMTPKQRDEANREFAEFVTRMLTVTCAKEARQAIKYEGATAIEKAFNLFGQVAARELFADPKVAEGLKDLEKYVDAKSLQKALSEDTSASSK
jgi:hypothetical protein